MIKPLDLIIIGVDPGSFKLGYAILKISSGDIFLLTSGLIVFKRESALQVKLFYFFNFFKKIIDSYFLVNCKIILSIERQFHYKNTQSAFVLVSFYSIFLLLAEMFQLHCISFMPTEVKKIVTGDGHASKEELFLLAERFLSTTLFLSSYDESDAILIALAAAITYL